MHIEEEMRVTKVLGDNVLKGSFWQVVDEKWLVKWRRFVSGRGARRYLPPGPITNDTLLHWERAAGKPGAPPIKRATPHADMNYDQKVREPTVMMAFEKKKRVYFPEMLCSHH